MSQRELTFEGIGTKWWIKLFDKILDDSWYELKKLIISKVKKFEDNYSRFNKDSYISVLNRQGYIQAPPLELYRILNYSEVIRTRSDGYFNIKIGRILEEWGYDSDYSFIEKATKYNPDRSSGFQLLSRKRIILKKGVKIDIGGVGKGWLIDNIKECLFNKGIKYFQINGGGDIYATSNQGKSLTFALQNPINETEMIGTINIINSSIASSGTLFRSWNNKFHHLVDLSNNKPSNQYSGVFTMAKDSLTADTASTLLFVTPFIIAKKVMEELEVEYLIINLDGTYSQSLNYPAMLNVE